MSTESHSRSSRAPSSSRRIADVIYRSLKTALTRQSPRRCGASCMTWPTWCPGKSSGPGGSCACKLGTTGGAGTGFGAPARRKVRFACSSSGCEGPFAPAHPSVSDALVRVGPGRAFDGTRASVSSRSGTTLLRVGTHHGVAALSRDCALAPRGLADVRG